MVHSVAVQSGGNVYIDTEIGKGTTIRLYIPRADEIPAAADGSDGSKTLPHAAATILVVDDDDDVREVAVAGLSEFGYHVLQASNGHSALEQLAREGKIDLMLIDLAMPGMNGAECARRARLIRPGMRVLYVTGYEGAKAIEGVGSDPLLHKPYPLERLVEALEAALKAAPPATATIIPLKTTAQRSSGGAD
jgi:CheY-like chemotaxis protein